MQEKKLLAVENTTEVEGHTYYIVLNTVSFKRLNDEGKLAIFSQVEAQLAKATSFYIFPIKEHALLDASQFSSREVPTTHWGKIAKPVVCIHVANELTLTNPSITTFGGPKGWQSITAYDALNKSDLPNLKDAHWELLIDGKEITRPDDSPKNSRCVLC